MSSAVWVPGNARVASASRVISVQPFFTYDTVLRSSWAPRKALEYPTRRHSSRNDRKPSTTAPDDVTEVGHLPPLLVHLRHHVLHERRWARRPGWWSCWRCPRWDKRRNNKKNKTKRKSRLMRATTSCVFIMSGNVLAKKYPTTE